MMRTVHGAAAAVAYTTIAAFLGATVVSELLLSHDDVVWVKRAIRIGLIWLVPAIAVAGATGFRLAQGRAAGRLIRSKKTRMPIIALNGILVLVPCALFLARRAEAGVFDTTFYGVQALELAAGAVNLALMSLSLRDGLRMSGRLRALQSWSLRALLPSRTHRGDLPFGRSGRRP